MEFKEKLQIEIQKTRSYFLNTYPNAFTFIAHAPKRKAQLKPFPTPTQPALKKFKRQQPTRMEEQNPKTRQGAWLE